MDILFVYKNAAWTFYAAFNIKHNIDEIIRNLTAHGYKVKSMISNRDKLLPSDIREMERTLNSQK